MYMKTYKIVYPDENDNTVTEILTEEEILNEYWDYWYYRMCQKFGEEHVKKNYTKQDCIDDWMVVHWATLENKE